ncbi:efflux RND transporter periplasmic adaptor subunit [Vibrio sp. VB16]|uniref:efflux RND transporter periplasmic adaptor subunit n=1 Tax=Vibrio sp. VB16 TaxID=2785746 RepID=UPI00189F8EC1|nr:efflux RND transporter periplasmic adaptor subunit [Vibrio sp. VB16]UGA56555.1 efflux RND transporter periplasmic adaptor subunit [Vibrio sp. VB16]
MKRKSLPILVTLISVACLASAVAYNGSQISTKDEKPSQNGKASVHVPSKVKAELLTANAPSVVVLEVEADTYKALVKGYGEASAHYAITYSSEVSGRVESLMPKFATGQLVKQGEVLATLENTSYLQAVAAANSNLAQAELDLLEEQRTGEQARLEWKRSGMTGEPNSPLVLRKPQLAAQQAVVENAKISLRKAQQDLEKTIIRAPFNALIVERYIQPGSYAQVGTSVAELYSTDRVEIDIPLSMKQWQTLPKLTNKDLSNQDQPPWPVTLYSADGENSWQGYVTRVEQHVDVTSRQRSLIIAVDKPFEQDIGLFPGTFVQAYIEGAVLDNTWELPASAISQQGDLWYLTENNQLNKVPANKVFEKSGSVYVSPIENLTAVKIIKRPLSNYVVGMLVTPKVEG